jgi:hypothetical protein
MRKLLTILLLLLAVSVEGQMIIRANPNARAQVASSSYPAVLDDGNTEAWYIHGVGVTKNVSNYVTQWDDQSGNDRDLVNPDGTDLPLDTVPGIYFDGIDDRIYVDYDAISQPIMVYLVINVVTHINNAGIFDAFETATLRFSLSDTGDGSLFVTAGTVDEVSLDVPLNEFCICRVYFNGESSKVVVNTSSEDTSPGTNAMNGLHLGARYALGTYSNIIVKELIVRSAAETSDNETAIYNYLKNKYGL